MCYDIKVIANILQTLISVRANFDDSYRANECRLHGNTGETQIPINSLGSRTAKFVSRKLKAAFIVSKVATRERERDRKTVSVPRREFLTRDLLSLRLSREARIYSFRVLISFAKRA